MDNENDIFLLNTEDKIYFITENAKEVYFYYFKDESNFNFLKKPAVSVITIINIVGIAILRAISPEIMLSTIALWVKLASLLVISIFILFVSIIISKSIRRKRKVQIVFSKISVTDKEEIFIQAHKAYFRFNVVTTSGIILALVFAVFAVRENDFSIAFVFLVFYSACFFSICLILNLREIQIHTKDVNLHFNYRKNKKRLRKIMKREEISQ